jgi:uncharacterized protein YkwD
MRAMSATSPRPARKGILLTAVLAAFLGLAVGPIAHPAPASAATASSLEGLLVKWINTARANHGVPPLRVGNKLTDVAGDKAASMAKSKVMSHASCLACVFRSYDISFGRCGEVLAYTTYPWGYQAARSIYNGWKGSSSHWSILMSRSFHRIGIGVAYRSSDHSTWAAGELAG